jgi:hypothetical protein
MSDATLGGTRPVYHNAVDNLPEKVDQLFIALNRVR